MHMPRQKEGTLQTIKVGIIGAGGIGTAHLRALSSLEGVHLVGICDVDERRAQQRASEVGAQAFTRHQDLLDAGVDAVWICVPPFARREPVLDAAKAKVHLFSEKPLAYHLEDADSFVEAVHRAGVNNVIGYVLRHSPLFRTMREIFASGALGDLVSVWCRRFMPWTPRAWYGDASLSEGIVVEFSTHDLDWVRWVGGEVKTVYARGAKVGTENWNNIWTMLTFANGATGVVGDSYTATIGGHVAGIIGTRGTLLFEGGALRKKLAGGEEETIALPELNAVAAEDAYFLSCIRAGVPAQPDWAEGREVLKVCLAAQQSAKEGKVIAL